MRLSGIADSSMGSDGFDAGGVRQRIPEGEGSRAKRRSPRDPPQLPAGGHRPHLGERARQRREAADEAHRQVGELEPIDRADHADKKLRVAAAARERDDPRRAEQRRGDVDEREQRA